MKSFKQYISEDIEVISGHPRTTKADMKSAQKDFEDDANYRKNLGKIHKDYSLHLSGRNFWITQDSSGKVVGHIDAEPFSGADKKSIAIAQLNIDKDHTKKNIGSSLAVAAYRHLHNMGYTIHSGDQQSIGAVKNILGRGRIEHRDDGTGFITYSHIGGVPEAAVVRTLERRHPNYMILNPVGKML